VADDELLKVNKKDEKWIKKMSEDIGSARVSMEYFGTLYYRAGEEFWLKVRKKYPQTKDLSLYHDPESGKIYIRE